MSCALPLVLTDLPSNREWVTHGRNGWLTPVGDPASLARTFLKAAGNRAALRRIGRRNITLVKKRGDWHKNIPKLLKAYAALKALSVSKCRPEAI